MSRAEGGPMVVALDGAQIRAAAESQMRHFEVTVGRVETERQPARHFAAAPSGVTPRSRFIGNALPFCQRFLRKIRHLYQALLTDASFHQQLLEFDRDLAATTRDGGCRICGGRLHSARFPRKPRGVLPRDLSGEYNQRFSFCCAETECRTRATPPSLRFLGCKV